MTDHAGPPGPASAYAYRGRLFYRPSASSSLDFGRSFRGSVDLPAFRAFDSLHDRESMIEYAPTPMVLASNEDLYVAYARFASGADGEPQDARYWDHAAGAWDAVFDQAKHTRSFRRMGPSGTPPFNFQSVTVPTGVAACRSVHALVFQAAAGSAAPPLITARDVWDGVAMRMYCSGLI